MFVFTVLVSHFHTKKIYIYILKKYFWCENINYISGFNEYLSLSIILLKTALLVMHPSVLQQVTEYRSTGSPHPPQVHSSATGGVGEGIGL